VTVEEIDEAGQAWVTMWLNSEVEEMDGHGIGLAPAEMELLSPGGAENAHVDADL
jgi:hypothetical protein